MATNIRSNIIAGIYIQSGNGIPIHLSTIGTMFVDVDVPSFYLSNGNGTWVNTTSTGSTTGGGGVEITGVTFNNNILTLLNSTGGTLTTLIDNFSGLTVNGGISGNTISATTFYGDGSQLTGIASEFTGGTVTGATIFTGDLSATTISATTYQNLPPITISVSLDGQGNIITTGSTGYRVVERSGNVTHWYVIADTTGSTIFDIKRLGVSIIGAGNKPTLSNQIRNNAVPSSWTSIAIAANDELEFVVNSASTITKAWLYVQIT
jgi:hypothetical protein